MKKLLLTSGGKDVGLFLLRVLTGLYMAFGHGFKKISGGPEVWVDKGEAMAVVFGISFVPVFWGFMAAFSEFVCSLLVVLGLYTRPASALALITMVVAGLYHVSLGDGLVGPKTAELAFGYAITFLALTIMGGGKYSVDEMIK